MSLPTLFQRDSKGKVRQWRVWTEGNTIVVEHGIQDGKLQQKRTVAKPKNVGKVNETTAEQQAIVEAQAKHRQQIEREDYNEDVDKAGLQTRPMLAHDYHKVPHRVDWNRVCAQPKLDGLRLVAGYRHSDVPKFEMLTRKGETHNVAHIVPEAEMLFQIVNNHVNGACLALDGEVYLHGRPLPWINSRAKKYYEGETESLEYHLFDLVIPGMGFKARHDVLIGALRDYRARNFHAKSKLVFVGVDEMSSKDEMRELHGRYVEEGYEGLMIRHTNGAYAVGDRSADLFKYKHFLDEECQIIEIWEDLNGNAMLTVQRKNGVTVDVTPKRTHEERKAMLERHDLKGRWITVKYQAETPDGSLQFPVGLGLREVNDDGEPIV